MYYTLYERGGGYNNFLCHRTFGTHFCERMSWVDQVCAFGKVTSSACCWPCWTLHKLLSMPWSHDWTLILPGASSNCQGIVLVLCTLFNILYAVHQHFWERLRRWTWKPIWGWGVGKFFSSLCCTVDRIKWNCLSFHRFFFFLPLAYVAFKMIFLKLF